MHKRAHIRPAAARHIQGEPGQRQLGGAGTQEATSKGGMEQHAGAELGGEEREATGKEEVCRPAARLLVGGK